MRRIIVRARFPWITRSLPMTSSITAFERSPDRGSGLARDLLVTCAFARRLKK